MILVGQYDSPYVRRVAVSLRVLGFEYEHDQRSVFGDFDSMRKTNPLGRIPSLVLDNGEILIDSSAILDWLDEKVGPERALVPPRGEARKLALKRIALATGAMDKVGAANYELLIRPQHLHWQEWIERCLTQARDALTALDHEIWPSRDKIDQAQITTAGLLGYIRLSAPHLLSSNRYPALDALWARMSVRPEFVYIKIAYGIRIGVF
ncbi:MAG: glutathione S-transferase family protein [Alphaproteobacteria bacterium]